MLFQLLNRHKTGLLWEELYGEYTLRRKYWQTFLSLSRNGRAIQPAQLYSCSLRRLALAPPRQCQSLKRLENLVERLLLIKCFDWQAHVDRGAPLCIIG